MSLLDVVSYFYIIKRTNMFIQRALYYARRTRNTAYITRDCSFLPKSELRQKSNRSQAMIAEGINRWSTTSTKLLR